MKKFSLLVLFFISLLVNRSIAQFDPNNTPSGFNFNGVISGVVIDSVTKKPVEYAAVTAIAMRDTSIAGGNITDENGKFSIDKLKPGRYLLRIKFIGYAEKTMRGIVLKPGTESYSVGTITISPAAENLAEVEVVTHTEVMEANLDKRVINVEKDLTSTGGTALDVMKNVPSVQVDMDNNVSLRGNNNVRILIDGRVTTLDPSTMLQQIPASMVKQIEVITNPSAKYDPDGVSGIINIITKKEKRDGLNGVISVGTGTGSTRPGGGIDYFTLNKNNFNTSLNYQVGKMNIYGSYDGRFNENWNISENYRELYRNDSTFILDQRTDKIRPGLNHSGKIGTDIAFTDNDLFSINGNIRSENNEPSEFINYFEEMGNGEFINAFTRDNTEDFKEFSYDGNINYKHKFKEKGHEILFDGSYSKMDNERKTHIDESYYGELSSQTALDSIVEDINESQSRQLISAQVDYVNPTEKYGRFESGLKYQGRVNQQDVMTYSNQYTGYTYLDTNRTNDFQYTDDIFSAYLIYANSFKKFKYQGGLRYEAAFTESLQKTLDTNFVYNYQNLFPTVHLKYVPKDEVEFSLSYSKRINRPGNQQLNPYPDYSDRQNFRIGNPYLKPEYVHSFELGYGKFSRMLSYTFTLFYRNTQNNFYRIRTIDPYTGISVVTFSNISQSHSAGVEMTYNQSITKWLRANANLSGFYYRLDADETFNTPMSENFSYTARGSLNITITKTFDVQLTGNYRGPMVIPQGEMMGAGALDIGMKKDFLEKRASLSFRVSDVFNTQEFRLDMVDPVFSSRVRHKRESRIANLTFTYKINKGVERKEKPRMDSGGGDFGM